MSTEIKVQTSPAPEAGAQTPLSPDAANGRTRGGDFNQNSLSFSRGAEVPASSESVSLLGVAGVNVSVRPVDRKTLEGSYPGDSRANPGDTAAASVAAASGSAKGPRDAVRQSQSSKHLP